MEAEKMVQRGDVYFADLGRRPGSVQSGVRPVVVIQNNKGNSVSSTVVVAPLTTCAKKAWMPVHVLVPDYEGVPDESMVLCEQICTLDRCQLGNYVCHLSDITMKKVNVAALVSIGLMPWARKDYSEGRTQMVLTLCSEHLRPYFDSKDYRVERLDRYQAKETCTCCNRSGYDYRITNVRG